MFFESNLHIIGITAITTTELTAKVLATAFIALDSRGCGFISQLNSRELHFSQQNQVGL